MARCWNTHYTRHFMMEIIYENHYGTGRFTSGRGYRLLLWGWATAFHGGSIYYSFSHSLLKMALIPKHQNFARSNWSLQSQSTVIPDEGPFIGLKARITFTVRIRTKPRMIWAGTKRLPEAAHPVRWGWMSGTHQYDLGRGDGRPG